MEKTIYPDYDFGGDGYRMGAMTHIRKQNDDGIWYLIPVVKRFESPKGYDQEELLNFIKWFHCDCYKTLLLYIIPKEGTLTDLIYGRYIGVDKDQNQYTEKERLSLTKVKV